MTPTYDPPRLTIDRARAIVDHAELLFATERLPVDAFSTFREGGAVDRQEAYTALLLIISDFFAAAQGRACERPNYDAYVRNSRSIAVRIACDGLDSAQSAVSLMLECRDSFDRYVCWLEAQDPNSATFWTDVQRRLGIHRATAPLLQLGLLARLDMEGFAELMGCAFQLPNDEALLRQAGLELSPGVHFSQYLVCKREGFALLFEDSVISAIWLHRKDKGGYQTFPRPLTGGIAFGARRRAIRRALGRPDASNGIEYRYQRNGYRLYFTFREWIGTLRLIGMFG